MAMRLQKYLALSGVASRRNSEKLIADYVRQTGCALILVTHSLQQARRIADEVLFFHKGKLLETGEKSRVLDTPNREETRNFLEFYGI